MTVGGQFDIPTITRSFETSLRELKAEYVDYLLLHDCTIDDLRAPELIVFLEDMKRQGKVRRFGLATDAATIRQAVISHPEYADVLQFPSSAVVPNIRKMLNTETRLVITHSALGTCLNLAHDKLQQHFQSAARLRERFGIDSQNKSELAKLLMRYAITENPGGLVLFSSTSEDNIGKNHQAAMQGTLSKDEIALLDSVLADSSPPLAASGTNRIDP
jgi:aryl-alcohol dehydrogenase-like predicted oxidoreductase